MASCFVRFQIEHYGRLVRKSDRAPYAAAPWELQAKNEKIYTMPERHPGADPSGTGTRGARIPQEEYASRSGPDRPSPRAITRLTDKRHGDSKTI